MSYQQTRSTQDPSFYPRNITSTLALSNAQNPLVAPSLTLASSPGKPPTTEITVSSIQNFTYPGSASFVYTAASANERASIEYFVNVLGTSGAITGLVGSQRQMLVATTAAGDTTNVFLGAGDISSNLTGFGLNTVSPGNTSVLNVVSTGAGNASITVTSIISRASA